MLILRIQVTTQGVPHFRICHSQVSGVIFLIADHDGKVVKSKNQFIGGLNLQDDYGLISFPPDGRKTASGQVLVEHEPVRSAILELGSPSQHCLVNLL